MAAPSWQSPTPVGCEPFSEFQRNEPPFLRNAAPDFLIRIPNAAVLKYNRTPFCVDLGREELLCHSSMDSVFCTPESYWQSSCASMQVAETLDLKGRALLLDSRFGKEFYHFYSSVLGRLAKYLSFDMHLDAIDHFILPEAAPFVVAWADILGIPPEKRRHLCERQMFRTDELLVPSNNHEFDHRTLAFIRNRIPASTKSAGFEKIYISRSQSVNGRHVLNEKQVIEQVLSPRGFRVVRLEDFSLYDQAAIMRSADTIVAPHGGGLTNVLFCRRGTRILELFNKNWIVFCYARIGAMLGLEPFYHVAADSHDMDIQIDVKAFPAVIDQCLQSAARES
ncbi:MAG: glycosyltransferase family 61 protein [Pirellulales bacterium]